MPEHTAQWKQVAGLPHNCSERERTLGDKGVAKCLSQSGAAHCKAEPQEGHLGSQKCGPSLQDPAGHSAIPDHPRQKKHGNRGKGNRR